MHPGATTLGLHSAPLIVLGQNGVGGQTWFRVGSGQAGVGGHSCGARVGGGHTGVGGQVRVGHASDGGGQPRVGHATVGGGQPSVGHANVRGGHETVRGHPIAVGAAP
jgi:hypothetical protein